MIPREERAELERRTRDAAPRSIDRKSILERYNAAQKTEERRVDRDRGPGRRVRDNRSRGVDARGDVSKRIQGAREHRAERIAHARQKTLADTRSLRDLARDNPVRARRYEQAGRTIARATDTTARIGLGISLGCVGYGSWGKHCGLGWGREDCPPYGWIWWWNGCQSSWWNWYGWCHPYGFSYWWYWGYWPRQCPSWWWYYPSHYAAPIYYSTVVHHYYEPEPSDSQASAREPEPEYVGEGTLIESDATASTTTVSDRELLDSLLAPSGQDRLTRASEEYLALGDNAFRERRFGDAVHFYAKAVEFAPDQGMLYLILSDGLFATGDYHYAAYALRKALELDPALATNSIDKHGFYADPAEFDRQLAVLELYLKDRPEDHDARLVLAANHLFGNRPAAAVDLLDDAQSKVLREEHAARLVYEAAKILQFGEPAGTRSANDDR